MEGTEKGRKGIGEGEGGEGEWGSSTHCFGLKVALPWPTCRESSDFCLRHFSRSWPATYAVTQRGNRYIDDI